MSTKYILAQAIATALLLSACAPKESTPAEIKTLSDKNSLNEFAGMLSTNQNTAGKWWQAFGDEQLDSLIDMALQTAPSLKSAELRLGQANNILKATQSSSQPTINANTSVSRERFSEHSIYPPPFGGGYYSNYQAGVSLGYDFDFWNAKSSQIELATQNSLAQEASLEASRLSLSSAIAKTYISWYFDNKKISILSDAVAASQESLDILNAKFAHGLVDEMSVNEQKSEISHLSQSIIATKRALDAEITTLCILLGKEPSFGATLKTPNINENTQLKPPKDIYINLLAHRPDVVMQRHIVKSKEAKVQNTKAAFYPSINLSGFLGFISMDLVKFTDSSSASPSGQVGISLPLFDAGMRKANFNIAEDDYNAAIYDYNSLIMKAANEVISALRTSQLIQAQMLAQDEDIKARESNEKIASKRLAAGINGKLPLLSAKITRLKSQLDKTTLLREQTESQITITEALGGGYYDKQGKTDAR